MSLSQTSKTKPSLHQSPSQTALSLDNAESSRATYIHLLGITIDHHLDFHCPIQDVVSKAKHSFLERRQPQRASAKIVVYSTGTSRLGVLQFNLGPIVSATRCLTQVSATSCRLPQPKTPARAIKTALPGAAHQGAPLTGRLGPA